MISTVMANLVLGRQNGPVLDTTVSIAAKLDAGVVGLAACRPIQTVCHDYAVPAALFDEDRKEIARHIEAGELEFRHAVARLKGRTEWRAHTTVLPLAEYLSRQARNADLVVVSTEPGDGQCDQTRRPDLCDFVMSVGRPVLLVPTGAAIDGLDRVVVAWKDTREARRAIVDALPILKAATNTTVVEFADDGEVPEARSGIAEVAAWLGHHGVKADARVMLSRGANASQLDGIARELEADLIVAGAYGYTRQGQWLLGGVTTQLLAGDRCAIVSH
ncbi:universal stress protein [Reyranella soli]|uniref:Universal stress protein UspA n=1 Tax=Reyranella soli TaxID=1230389 RepID=A0A512N7H8_9HYPH|nr:universal stress protein [Reyranella soli]GEP54934.1 universal stress protein UspA [Reyranella soli]